MSERSRHAANAAAGLTLTGAGEALGQYGVRQGASAGRRAAVHLGGTGLKGVGIPLAAAGAVGAARDRGKAQRFKLSKLPKEVARNSVPMPKEHNSVRAKDAAAAALAGGLGGTVLRQAGHNRQLRAALGTAGGLTTATGMLYGRQRGREAQRRQGRVTKAMSDTELRHRKALQSKLSITGGTMGLAALASRGAAAKPALKLARVKNPAKVAGRLKETSNLLTTAGAGVGGVGAFNFAAYTNAEAKRRRMATAPVRKDAFTRRYAQHISPSAEQGYEYLRRGRNRQAGWAAANAALTGVNAHAAVRGGRVGRPLAIGLGALTATNAVRNARGAKRWNGHMKKIKAKAYERAARGELGRGREVAKEDLAKAMFRVRMRPAGLPYPKGLRRSPSLRDGSVRRTASGKMVAFRGSYG